MKDSHGIKKLYGGARRGYGSRGRICRETNLKEFFFNFAKGPNFFC